PRRITPTRPFELCVLRQRAQARLRLARHLQRLFEITLIEGLLQILDAPARPFELLLIERGERIRRNLLRLLAKPLDLLELLLHERVDALLHELARPLALPLCDRSRLLGDLSLRALQIPNLVQHLRQRLLLRGETLVAKPLGVAAQRRLHLVDRAREPLE